MSSRSYLRGVELAAYQSRAICKVDFHNLKKKSQTFTVTFISMAFTLSPHLYLKRIKWLVKSELTDQLPAVVHVKHATKQTVRFI